MLYNEMIPVDTHDTTGTETNFCGPFGKGSGLYSMESNYETPALPGGGGSTPPSLPSGGLPGLGGGQPGGSGAGSGSTSGGGKAGDGAGQYITPETIAAGTSLIGGIFGAIGAGRTPQKVNIKAVCGRKPLFNIGGKKDAYFACAERVINPQPIYTPPVQTGITSAKVIIGVLVFLLFLAIIITVIVLMKRKGAEAPVK